MISFEEPLAALRKMVTLDSNAVQCIWPLALMSFCINALMFAGVTPDRFMPEAKKSDMAPARPLVPASGCIMTPPPIIMPPIMIWLPLAVPSIVPSDASAIMSVTSDDDTGMPTFFAYWDMAARVIP